MSELQCSPLSHLYSQKRRHMEPKYHFSWICMIFHSTLTLMHFSLGWSIKSIITKLIALVAVQFSPSPSPDTPVWVSKYRQVGGGWVLIIISCPPLFFFFFSSFSQEQTSLLLFKPSPPTFPLVNSLHSFPFPLSIWIVLFLLTSTLPQVPVFCLQTCSFFLKLKKKKINSSPPSFPVLTEVLKEQTETPSLFMHSPLIHYNLTSIFSCFIDIAHLDIKNYLLITKSNVLYHFFFHSFAPPPHLSSYQLLCTLSSVSNAYFLLPAPTTTIL